MKNVPVNVAVIDRNTITKAEVLRSEKSGKTVKIKAAPGVKYLLAEGENGVAPENITLKRVGKNLLVCLEGTDFDQPQLIIEDFFDHPGELIGLAEDGNYHEYIAADGDSDHDAAFLIDGNSSGVVLGADSLTGLGNFTAAEGAFSPAWLALGALAALAAATGIGYLVSHKGGEDNGGNGGGEGGGGVDPDPNPGHIAKPELPEVTDNVGSVTGPILPGSSTDDTTPTFTGSGKPGNIISIIDNGKVVGSTTVDKEGNWTFTPEVPLENGDHSVVVVEEDHDGNTSEPSDKIDFNVDTIAPAKGMLTHVMDDVESVVGDIPANGITNDSRPTFVGTAEPGATVMVYANGSLLGSVEVDGKGNWSFTPSADMADNAWDITLTVKDAAGNVSLPTDPFHFTIDTQAPEKPGNGDGEGGIGDIYDDVAPVTGSIENGGSTNDKKPELSGGDQQPGDKVTIIDNGKEIGTAIVDENGNWTFEPDEELAEGNHELIITITDPAGNTSEESDPYVIVVDTTPPQKPAIGEVTDDVGDRTGALTSGDVTDDARPTISGTAEPLTTVIVKDNGQVIGTAKVDADGNWSLEPEFPLPNGQHSLTAEAVDKAGNTSEPSDSFDYSQLAGGSAGAPAITGVYDDEGTRTGNITSGALTDDAQPEIQGTAQTGSIVRIYDGTTLLGSTTAVNGQWSFTPSTPLVDGPHSITATAENAAGNLSPATAPHVINVDTTAPDAADNLSLTDDVGAITGEITDGSTTDDSTPTFSGTAEPGALVIISDNGQVIGSMRADSTDGTWSFEPSTPLVDGSHSLTTEVEDAAGNRSPGSAAIDFEVDTRVVTISIDYAVDDVEGITGNMASGTLTNDTTPTLHGKATPGSVVKIYEGDTLLGSASVNPRGEWSFTSPALTEGSHSFTATVVTKAGGESAPTAAFELTIDTTAPGNGNGESVIGDIIDNVGNITGSIGNGGETDDTTPEITGNGQQPGDKVTVIDNGQVIGTAIVGPGGTWTFTPNPPLVDGTHEISVVVTDPAGNSSDASDPYTIIVDTTPPTAPVITSVVDDQGAVTGPLNAGATTDDASPTISGTAEPFSTIIIRDNGQIVGSTTADKDGLWSLDPELPLPNGTHSLTAESVDKAGNVGTPSASFDYSQIAGGAASAPAITGALDDQGSVTGNLTSGSVTDDTQPEIQGTAQTGSIVRIYDGTTLLGSTTAVNGQWSFTPSTPLVDGPHSITATAENAAGNLSPATAPHVINVDTTAPDAADNLSLTDDVGTITGEITDGSTTDDSTPTFSGTAEPGALVIISDNGQVIGSVRADATDGTWSFEPSTPLVDGSHSLTTEVEDAAGNRGTGSTAIDFVVDTRAVEVTIDSAMDDVEGITGSMASGSLTNDTTPTLHGKATAGAVVNIYEGTTLMGTAIVSPTGSWEFTMPVMADGTHSFTATVVTAASGESTPTAAFELVVDTTAPDNADIGIGDIIDNVGSITGSIGKGGETDDTTPEITGNGQQPGDKVTIIDNGQAIGTAIVGPGGEWSFTPNPPLVDGEHEITVVITDPAGNSSDESDPYVITVDTTPPVVPTIDTVFDDQGAVTGALRPGETTDDAKPVITGKAEANCIIIVKDGSTVLGSTTADDLGNWHFEPEFPLANGAHSLTVEAVDAAGNVSNPSTSFDYVQVTGGTPSAPAITGVIDDQGTVSGNISPGSVTDDTQPEIQGTAPAGSTVNIYINGNLVGSTTAGPGGFWSYTPETPLTEGGKDISVTVLDAQGNEGTESALYTITVDTTPPVAAGNLTLTDDVGAVTGNITSGTTTDDSTPTFSGTAEAGAMVIISDSGVVIGSARADATDGSWSFEPATPLTDGSHSFTTEVVDMAGNRGPASAAIDFTVNTAAVNVSIGYAVDDVKGITGNMASGALTNDTTPTLHGKATAGAIVNIYEGTTLLGTASVDSRGNWSFTSPVLADGTHNFTATVVTAANGESAPTAAFELVIDATASANSGIGDVIDNVGIITGSIADGNSTDDTTPDIAGSGQLPGEIITVIDNGSVIGTAIVKGDGSWTFTPYPPLNDGKHELSTIVTDKAGNSSAESDPYVINIDTSAPQAPAITSVVDDVGTTTGPLAQGDSTDDAKPTIKGTAGAEEWVVIRDNGKIIGSTQADPNGDWEFTPGTSLSNGAHSLTAEVVNATGNSSKPSDAFGLNVLRPVSSGYDSFNNQTLTPGLKLEGSIYHMPSYQTDLGLKGGILTIPWNSEGKIIFPGEVESFYLYNDAGRYTLTAYNIDNQIVTDFSKGDLVSYIVIKTGNQNIAATGVAFDWMSWTAPKSNGELKTFINESDESNDDVSTLAFAGSDENDTADYHDAVSALKEGHTLDGKGGIDTLQLNGSEQVLDFAALEHKISSFEVIDITGSGNNTLKLAAGDVLDNGGKDLFIADGSTQMMIKGNAGDSVELSDLLPDGTDTGDWTQESGTITVGGEQYQVFHHSGLNTELLVQQGVDVKLDNH